MREWVVISHSGGSSQPRNRTWDSCVSSLADGPLTAEPPRKPKKTEKEGLRGDGHRRYKETELWKLQGTISEPGGSPVWEALQGVWSACVQPASICEGKRGGRKADMLSQPVNSVASGSGFLREWQHGNRGGGKENSGWSWGERGWGESGGSRLSAGRDSEDLN